MRGLTVTTSTVGDVVVATLRGDIDLVNHEEAGEQLLATALAHGPLFVIDFDGVEYVDSNGVRMLFALAQDLENSRIEWAAALSEDAPLSRLFKVTTFDEVANICDCVSDAVAAVGTGR
jgi:stage II sporulation protein AA (anti-sigma F factor antagonist)